MPKKRGNATSGRSSGIGQPKQLRRAGTPSAETPQVESQQQHPQDLQFVVSGFMSNENTIDDQRANIAAEANQATYRIVRNHRIMANEHGASLFESVEELKEDVKDVKKSLALVLESLMNVRERNYLTFLRDRVAGFNRTHRNRISILNTSEVHGGDALLDASMFLSRRDHCPEEPRIFKRIYGLSAEKLQELQYATHPSILRLLNTVGYAHLSGKIALREEKVETTFDRVVELVENGEIEEAERLASELSPNDFDFSYQCDE
ncbi:hypothetical protein N7454_008184 [Penicillium verhagenii]|nr:hypothetical protein N7454_008184 [Penicillium verhagenii]